MARTMLDIEASPRELANKSHLRRLRQEGNIPGVIYGKDVEAPIHLTMNEKALLNIFRSEARHLAILNLKLGSGTHTAILKAIGRDPVTSKPIHLDFQTVNLKEKTRFNVPIVLKNTEAATKIDLILQTPLEEVEVESLPLDCPLWVELDVSQYAHEGAVAHVKDLAELADKVELLTDPEAPILVVSAPSVAASTTEGEGAEGGEEKKEEGGE